MPRGPRFRLVLAPACVAAVLLISPDGRSGTAQDAPERRQGGDGGAPAAADVVPEIQAVARSIAAEHALEGATVGIAAIDLDSGRPVALLSEHLALNPASCAKLYTAAAALAILHGDHRYETTLSGKLEGDAVSGPLALRGYGDPSLGTEDLWAMVQELRDHGVKRVEGDVVVDQAFYDEQTTPPAFEQQPNEWAAFRAPVSAVSLDENTITMTVRPSASGGDARVTFDPPGFVDAEAAVHTVDGEGADTIELALAGAGPRMTAKVSGTIGRDAHLVRFTRRAEDPRLLPGYALKALLEKADVKVSGDVKLGPARGRVLARHQSAPLSSLLYELGKHSDNFYAETIFKSLGGEGKARPAKAVDSAELVTQFLGRIGAMDQGVSIKNGSGLFDANRVTASSTVSLLRAMWKDPTLQPEYVAQLSVGGVDGTLRKRFRMESTKRRVRAKTGTLDDVIALSGYVLRDSGRPPIAFSILFNHAGGKQDAARHAADRLVEAIAKWTQGR
jgi:D-alanyl-D-alanine carboxypeptidase/D-alanyl-D-alanine-endopeptidase (penicillin-binding protein 4)